MLIFCDKIAALFDQEEETLTSIAEAKICAQINESVTRTNVKSISHIGTEKPSHWKIGQ